MIIASAGYNIHARNIKQKKRLTDHTGIVKPPASVIMDDLGVADEIRAVSVNTLTIYRHYGTDGDENDYLQYTARAYLESRKPYSRHAIYVLNEPPFNAQVIKWLIEVIELNEKEYHFTLVIGNFATGNPTGNVIEAWKLAHDLLVLLDKYRDHVYLGLHQYAGAVITSGLYGGYPDKAGEKQLNLIPPANWPKAMIENGVPITRFHVGREWFCVEYCKIAGINPPRIIITEALFDDTSDIDGWLKSLPAAPPYQNVSGYKTLRAIWRTWFPEWSLDRAYFEQLKYAIEVIWKDSPVEAVCLFCWGHSSERWDKFDLEDAVEFQDLLVQYTKEAAPVFPLTQDSRWQLTENQSGENYRIRLIDQTDDTPELGWIRSGERFYWIDRPGELFIYGKNISGTIGYVSRDVLSVAPKPEPVPPPAPPPLSKVAITEQIAAINASITTLTKYRAVVDVRVSELEDELSAERHLSNGIHDSIEIQKLVLTYLQDLLDVAAMAA